MNYLAVKAILLHAGHDEVESSISRGVGRRRCCGRSSRTAMDAASPGVRGWVQGETAIALVRRVLGTDAEEGREKAATLLGCCLRPCFVSYVLREGDDIVRLGTLLALAEGELHLLAFAKRLEPFAANRAVVHEHIFALLALNEAKSLGLVEPLDRSDLTICHGFLTSCMLGISY